MTLRQLVARERFRLVATMGARGAAFSIGAAALLIGLAAFWLGDARWISEPAAPAIAWLIVLLAIGAPLAWTIVRIVMPRSRASSTLRLLLCSSEPFSVALNGCMARSESCAT